MAYTTISDVRAVGGMEDIEVWSDAQVTEAITYAEAVIDDYCGTSFEYRAFSVTLDGTNATEINTGVMYLQSITSLLIDGVEYIGEGYDYGLTDTGVLRSDALLFDYTAPGLNVTIVGTAGWTSEAPVEISLAARTIAIGWLRQLEERIPERALSVQSEVGQIILAQPGAPWRPTEYPQVNALLNRWRARPPALG